MNVLFLVPKHVYDTKMARERFAWMRAVQEQIAPHGVHTTGPGWPDWPVDQSNPVNQIDASDFIQRYLLARPDREEHPHVVVVYEVPIRHSPIPVCVILQEAYDRPKTLALIRQTQPKLVVFTYANELPQYQAEFEAEGRTCVHIPHGVDTNIFTDYEEPKSIDVLVVGNMNQHIYPFRVRLARLAWRELRKRGYKVELLPHPGYTLPPKAGLVGTDYARHLSRARLVVTCTSRYKYALSKLIEIPMCGALPVSDLPAERQRFFQQTMLHVEPWMLDREICQGMEDVLDDEADWAARVKLAQEKILPRLPMRYWAERFIYACKIHLLGEVGAPAPQPLTDAEDA